MFGLILFIAQTNPKVLFPPPPPLHHYLLLLKSDSFQSFIVIMEFVTSFAINIGSGCFITWMFGISRIFPKNYPKIIPLAMPDWVYSLRWLVMLYFVFAVIYDLLLVGYNFLRYIS